MPDHRPLQPASPWVQVVATDADWDAADPALLRTIYAQLVWIRAFEQYVLDLAGAGLIHGPAHSSIGQEGGAVGSVLAFDQRGLRQRVAPWPPPVPGQGAAPRRAQGPRPARAAERRRT